MNNTGRINKIRARSNFTQIHNDVLQNVELSLAARGLLAFILSLPDDWILMKDSLHTRVGAKKGTVDAVFKELQVFGYIISTKCMDEKGRFQGWNHDVYEDPSSADKDVYRSRFFPKSVNAEVGESAPIQRNNIIGLQSTKNNNNNLSENFETDVPSFVKADRQKAREAAKPLPTIPELKENLLNDKTACEILCMQNKVSIKQLQEALEMFSQKLIVSGEEQTKTKFRSYFGNWLPKNIDKLKPKPTQSRMVY